MNLIYIALKPALFAAIQPQSFATLVK